MQINIQELQEKTKKLKEEKNAVILVHNYQRPEIQDVGDYVGDSLGLSKEAASTDSNLIVFCGVRFMAETAKILSPEKKVLIPRPKQEVECPMAGMVSVQGLKKLRQKYPEANIVSYVNTNADVKAESDVCCTSSNAVKVVENVKSDQIIFVPDKNLASYVSRFVNKEIIPWDGYCYVHDRISAEEVSKAKQDHPDALLLVHPECRPSVVNRADRVLSTGGLVSISKNSDHKTFLIGTEEGIIYRLKKENPNKKFYAAGIPKVCINMKKIQLEDVYKALKDEKYKIELSETIIKEAKTALDRMLEYV
ncbi:MAG: quinolinate synthase NadA [Candidatus Aminicenantes bacterium]|nr:quinolinate synthase NadA [Candidatus Aminicenantes bacterium]